MPEGYDRGPALFVPAGSLTWTIRPAGFAPLGARQADELRQVDHGLASVARTLGELQAGARDDAPERAIADAETGVASVQADDNPHELLEADGQAHAFARALDDEAANPANPPPGTAVEAAQRAIVLATHPRGPVTP